MKISKKDLLDKYGLDLDVGKYSIKFDHENNKYIVSSVKDDTSGCILVGENKVKGKVINSTQYELALVDKMIKASQGGEKITITIS